MKHCFIKNQNTIETEDTLKFWRIKNKFTNPIINTKIKESIYTSLKNSLLGKSKDDKLTSSKLDPLLSIVTFKHLQEIFIFVFICRYL